MRTFLLLLVFALLFLAPVFADEALERQVLELADALRCPTCQGLSVKESNSAVSEGMKNEIRQQLQAGKTKAEVLRYFEERYGEWILRVPEAKGANLSLWIFPAAVFLVGLLVLFLFIRQKKRADLSQSPNP